MTILFCDLFESFTADTVCRYLRKMGHACNARTYYTPADLYHDDRLYGMIRKDLKEGSYDCVMSIDFWPLVARACHQQGIRYLAWSYDSPQNLPTEQDMAYETNDIFLFDRAECESYHRRGIDRVHHLPLATDISFWDGVKKEPNVSYPISLIGNIYESTLPALLNGMDEYDRGYCRALVSAQQKIYGYYLIDELLPEERLSSINASFEKHHWEADPVTDRQLSYSMGRYVTYLDRVTLLRLFAKIDETHLFSYKMQPETASLLKGVHIHEAVSYERGMPKVFKASRINLNPILRVIKTGIPQRALDIMGCGGFLLSSWQPELAEQFIANEECVFYDSYEDACAKAQYYLTHESERERIAAAGYARVSEAFSYPVQLRKMFEMAGGF